MSRIKSIFQELKGNMTTPRRTFAISLGGVLFLVGLVTTPIPIFPSRAVMLPGLVILSVYSPTAYRWLKQKTDGHPRIESFADRARNRIINFIHPSK